MGDVSRSSYLALFGLLSILGLFAYGTSGVPREIPVVAEQKNVPAGVPAEAQHANVVPVQADAAPEAATGSDGTQVEHVPTKPVEADRLTGGLGGEGSAAPLYKITGDLTTAHRFFHISDTHIDPFFDPTMSMQVGVCHSCQFSNKAYGDQAYCPNEAPHTEFGEAHLTSLGYAFGRYGCNPPRKLFKSLVAHLKKEDPDPKFMIFTGDIAPHGYPDDGYKLTPNSKLDDLCGTKAVLMRQSARELHNSFPNTKFAFTMGNNDHFPKNVFWQPWIEHLGNIFEQEGFFTKEQAEMFRKYGSQYVDHDNTRFICPDLTLFAPGGEPSWVKPDELRGLTPDQIIAKKFPIRERVVNWVAEALKDAKEKGLAVYIVGHQPLTTKKGKDELDVEGIHYGRFRELLSQYHDIIKAGFFGHRNLAGLNEILSTLGNPLIPSITAPGISPRGKNQPCFNTVFMDPKTSVVLEIEQWTFNLMDENEIAKKSPPGYLGVWGQHKADVYSWRALSGETEFTAETLARVLTKIPRNARDFFAIEVWKRAGYIGDETPENYMCNALHDTGDLMMRCLFPNQDPKCWMDAWLH